MVPSWNQQQETALANFKTSNELIATELDNATLESVAGGFDESILSPQLRLAFHPVGGWTMPDPFAKPVLGRYFPQ